MSLPTASSRVLVITLASVVCCHGCATSRPQTQNVPGVQASGVSLNRSDSSLPPSPAPTAGNSATNGVQLAAHWQTPFASESIPAPLEPEGEPMGGESPTEAASDRGTSVRLEDLEAEAIANHPGLTRLRWEAAAASAKTGYAGTLPDPILSSMFFIPPMHFDPDRQISEVQIMQTIPWLGRLGAETQRAHLEALAAQNEYHAERLRVIGDLRAAWFELYVLEKQIEITQAEQAQLQSLLTTASARVATGTAQAGDVLLANLQLNGLQEQLLGYRQQVVSKQAEINRLAGRPSSLPIDAPVMIDVRLPDWDHESLRGIAIASQPELNAARLRTAATRWGIEVARLQRRPDVTISSGWMAMDAPGAAMPGAGADSWTLGVSTSLPIWRRKYDSLFAEASNTHCAAHASEEEIMLQLDATLRSLWEQAQAAQETIELYETAMLPQARQTLRADQASLANNTVSFERVIEDHRTLLRLEVGYHRALGQLATIISRIRQTVGTDLGTNSPVNSGQPASRSEE